MRARSVRFPPAVLGLAERESMLVVVLGAYACGLIVRLPDQLRQDGWLALVGGRFVAHAGLPSSDSLTTWTTGTKWIDQQWLGQLLFFRLFQAGGIQLVMLVHVALLAAALALAVTAGRWRGGSARSVALTATLALTTIIMSAQLRAQSFAYVLFVGLVWVLIADARRPTQRVYVVLPLLVVWTNLHGSVVLGAALVILRAVFLLFERQRLRGITLGLGAIACVLASPYGFSLLGYYRSTLFNPSFSRIVTEWQRSTPSLLTASFYALAFVGMWLVGRHGGRLTRFEKCALLLTVVAGMLALRNMVWFCYLAVIVLPAALCETLAAREDDGARPRFKIGIALASCVALLAAASAAAAAPASWYAGKTYPARATRLVAAAASADPSLHVFADIRYADWLLWEQPALAGHVMYDARLELLRHSQLEQLYRWTNDFSSSALRGSDLLVLDRSDHPRGFRRVYAGGRLAIFVRAHLWRSMNASTRPHASSDASANSSCLRSKKLCGAPS
jgi:hypothetical protein